MKTSKKYFFKVKEVEEQNLETSLATQQNFEASTLKLYQLYKQPEKSEKSLQVT
jgi:hypothetical protein